MSGPTAVVVGASVAGVHTARALRAEGWPGRVVLVGAEDELPYDKPPLSKELLAGDWEPERARLIDGPGAEQAGIELRLGCPATQLDVAGRAVRLADGSALAYDAVVLATGADARPFTWAPPSGVHVLRTLRDALGLREALAGLGHVVVVGAGFVGTEVASTARAYGCEVTMIDPLDVPLQRALGREAGALFAGLHARHGVRTRFGTGVEAVTGQQGDLRLLLDDGTALAAETVVVGIGADPTVGWLAGSGLDLSDGVLCDATGAVCGAAGVFAVGDVARWHAPRLGRAVRVEHWTSAVEQAGCVARAIARPDEASPLDLVPYVWTDQHDWRAQVVGDPAAGGASVQVGTDDRFALLTGDGDSLAGGVFVNWPKAMLAVRRLAAAGTSLPAAVERVQGLPGQPRRP